MNRKIGPHYRAPWTAQDPSSVRVSTKYDVVKSGTPFADRGSGKAARQKYESAKRERNHQAAAEIVDAYATDAWIDNVVDDVLPYVEEGRQIIFVWPMPGFAGSDHDHDGKPVSNALPAAVAAALAKVIGGELNETIVQIARPGRTKLKKLQRYLYQPTFDGDVDEKAAYVLVDDACTTGGTLAALRTHIIGKGGMVVAAAALCSPSGEDCPFPLAPETKEMLFRSYGPELRTLWVEEIGHDVEFLTEGEGRGLRVWGQENADRKPIVHALRDRFDKIRSRGDES